jgi:Flp pilus assembly pilin Flp
MWKSFCTDETGAIISAELVLLLSILAVGMTVGLSTIRDSVTTELSDVGQAISNNNQSYVVGPINSPSSSIAGFGFNDALDFCDSPGVTGPNSRCVMIASAPSALSNSER